MLEAGHHPVLAASRFGDLLTDLAPGLGWGLAVSWSPSGALLKTKLLANRLQNVDLTQLQQSWLAPATIWFQPNSHVAAE